MESIACEEARNASLPSPAPDWRYVLDFYCAEARLAVEIDGMSHDLGDRPQRDANRDAWLKARGLTVMRIAASEVIRNAMRRPRRSCAWRPKSLGAPPPPRLRAVPLPRFAGEGETPRDSHTPPPCSRVASPPGLRLSQSPVQPNATAKNAKSSAPDRINRALRPLSFDAPTTEARSICLGRRNNGDFYKPLRRVEG